MISSLVPTRTLMPHLKSYVRDCCPKAIAETQLGCLGEGRLGQRLSAPSLLSKFPFAVPSFRRFEIQAKYVAVNRAHGLQRCHVTLDQPLIKHAPSISAKFAAGPPTRRGITLAKRGPTGREP